MSDNEKDDHVTTVQPSESSAVESPAIEDPATGTSSPGATHLPLIARALVVVALVFAVLVGWLAWGMLQDSAAEAARQEARAVAEEQAVAMLAYNYETVDEQTAAAAGGLTGDFRDEYTNLMADIIAPGAKEKAISVQVSVQASSVVSADTDRAVTLLFLNQITTSSENPEAVSSGSRVRIELEKHDDRWLVSRLTPI
ncbi:twin-arginine translocation pathway signal [Rhodococcus chondri]|uniref:Twin-arginine translocation pathway signal n=1 Tax=Rhodococcus chondri TaxID=3065941 RepID=A0ABU7JRN1_9NOCA|nr:twin-arginine translocation pathway signal [Rhodococcus sp. CC-R104]MEE2032696.1 twin-arginine translocation pathway signal [Rhodococcus sp. CC-R104]